MYRVSLQVLSAIFFIPIRTERDMIEYIYCSVRKVTVILVRFYWNLNFLDRFWKKIFKYQISCQSVQWEPSCSMRTDGRTHARTDVTKLIFALRSFANAPEKKKRGDILVTFQKERSSCDLRALGGKVLCYFFWSLMGKDAFYYLMRCIKRHFQLH